MLLQWCDTNDNGETSCIFGLIASTAGKRDQICVLLSAGFRRQSPAALPGKKEKKPEC